MATIRSIARRARLATSAGTVMRCFVWMSASRTLGGGALGGTASSGALLFTGISLAATVLVSLVLMTLGFALRRRANAKQ